jgi:hypothetical protein
MFSCLGRLGCLFLLIICGAIAFLTRDRWLPRITGERPAPPPAWESVKAPGAARGEQRSRVTQPAKRPRLRHSLGSELAALLVQSAGHAFRRARFRAGGNRDETIRSCPRKAGRRQGLDALGPLSGLLASRTDRVLGHARCPSDPGLVSFASRRRGGRSQAAPCRRFRGSSSDWTRARGPDGVISRRHRDHHSRIRGRRARRAWRGDPVPSHEMSHRILVVDDEQGSAPLWGSSWNTRATRYVPSRARQPASRRSRSPAGT